MPEDNVAIHIKNVGKRYFIGGHKDKYLTFRDTVAGSISNLITRHSLGHLPQEFWALKDVSFDVERGEVIGIIGPNGAGKSTLLKILSRITPPTTGVVDLFGRVGTLLEVGTGFHPELTGRENIFLSGSILGMKKREIEDKLDDIVAFSEIEEFLETPVKRYSSGMYVRLAFAVAAHLEPEILLVDEVLAVGDAAFQKKCLGKMGAVAREGRTVLFVSHNMAAVKLLCPRSIYLSGGKVAMDDSSQRVIDMYIYGRTDLTDDSPLPYQREYHPQSAPGDEYVRLKTVQLIGANGMPKSSFDLNEGFFIQIEYEILKQVSNFQLYVRVYTNDGILAFCSSEWDGVIFSGKHQEPGVYRTRIAIPPNLLNTGIFSLSVMGLIYSVRIIFEETDVLRWKIKLSEGIGGIASIERRGIFRPLLRWSP